MAHEYIKEAPEFVAAHADNWLISATNVGPQKFLSLSLVRYVVKHIKGDDHVSTVGTENVMELLATYSISEELAIELSQKIPLMLAQYELPTPEAIKNQSE